MFCIPIVKNSFYLSYFLIFLLVSIFALLNSSIACYNLFGINVKEIKKRQALISILMLPLHICRMSKCHNGTSIKTFVSTILVAEHALITIVIQADGW